jgi:hypothetical protein
MLWSQCKSKKRKKRSTVKGLSWWKKKAWDQFSLYIRVRDALRTTGGVVDCVCCSCGRVKPAFGKGCIQAGHFIPGRKNIVLFSEIGVHGQCSYCNGVVLGGLKGNWPGYYEFMLKHYNQEVINHLLIQAKQVKKYTPIDLEEMRDDYKRRYTDMVSSGILVYGESYEDKLLSYCKTHRVFVLGDQQ